MFADNFEIVGFSKDSEPLIDTEASIYLNEPLCRLHDTGMGGSEDGFIS